MRRALALRAGRFRGGGAPALSDRDPFDPLSRHMLVEDRATGALVCTYRMLHFPRGAGLTGAARSYTGGLYGLSGLMQTGGPLLEMGRFCIAGAGAEGTGNAAGDPAGAAGRAATGANAGDPEIRDAETGGAGAGGSRASDADILRVAWGAMTRYVDACGARLLFGCASFAGTDPGRYGACFALLRERYLAPAAWRPSVKAAEVARFADFAPEKGRWDPRRAAAALPPLLRSYLAMGGRVSDHAVIDRDLGTLHVFTGLEIAAIPPARARALRLVAG